MINTPYIRGSIYLGRLANYYSDRFVSYIFLDIGYIPPFINENFSIDAFNDASTKAIGYPVFGYWYFFEADDSAELMDRDVCPLPLALRVSYVVE